MYGVAHDGVVGDVARYVVALHDTVVAVLNHDAELAGPEHAVAHVEPLRSLGVNATVVHA